MAEEDFVMETEEIEPDKEVTEGEVLETEDIEGSIIDEEIKEEVEEPVRQWDSFGLDQRILSGIGKRFIVKFHV